MSEELAQCCTVASPHIAGYSTLGKLRGSFVVANALLAHFGQPPHIARLEALQRAMGLPACDIAWPALANTEQWQESLASILAELAGLEALTARFKRSALGDAAQFDAMRKTYNTRFELAECDTTHVSSWPKGLIAQLAALVDA